jgi:hypothetical protein
MQSFAVSAGRVGRKIITPVNKEPVLREWLHFYMDAFIDLDSERSHGMGWMRIPWTSIVSYGLYYDLDDEQMDFLVYAIQRVDLAHIARLEEKRANDVEVRRKK